MKVRQLFLSLLGVLALYSCSQGSGPSEQPTRDEVTATFEMDLEAVYGGAPSAVADADGDLKALSFDTSHETPIFIHEDGITSWKTHCFLRKADGTAQVYAEVDWDATVENGSINLKMKGHKLTLLSSGGGAVVTPQPGEEWYISGITGDGRLNADRTQVDYRPDPNKDATLQPHQARVPLAFGWKKFKVAAASGERAPKVKVVFKPQGSLLRVAIDNTTAVNAGTFNVVAPLSVRTNALTTEGVFDYSIGVANFSDERPIFTFANATASEETISRAVSVKANTKAVYVLWGYPRPASHLSGGSSFRSETTIAPYRTFGSASKSAPAMRSKAYYHAIAHASEVFVERPHLPIEYVAEYNMGSDTEFATSHRNNQSAYYTWNDAVTKFSNITIGGRQYHLPSLTEARALFYDIEWGMTVPRSYNSLSFLATVAGVQSLYQEKRYAVGDQKTAYAIRFIDADNRYRCAYRYKLVGNAVLNNMDSHLEISVRYIGNTDETIEARDLANKDDAYWQGDMTAKRIIPMTGWNSTGLDIGRAGFLWTSTEDNYSMAWDINLYHNYGHTGGSSYEKTHALAVRLWRSDL